MSNPNALASFSSSEAQRIAGTFERLIPHLTPGEFAIVGGLAIRHFVASQGRPYPERPFNDVDLVVRGKESVLPSITEDLKLAHLHMKGPKPFFQVVDPITKVKVDIFHWPVCEPTITDVQCGDRTLPFHSPEDQFAKTIWDTTKVLRGEAVDLKQFSDAHLLADIADPERSSEIFMQLYGDAQPAVDNLQGAFDLASQKIINYPELVLQKPSEPLPPSDCAVCITDPQYPLTPLSQIYELTNHE